MSDGPSDPILNCLLEVCCASGSASQRAAMAECLSSYCAVDLVTAKRVGDWMLATFDLAEKGSLQAFKASVVRVYKARAIT